MKEQVYGFEFTESQVNTLKHALRCFGLSFVTVRDVYKILCEAVMDDFDKQQLARYE